VLAFAVASRVIAESRNPAGRRLDLPGQVLAILTLGSLTFALIEGNSHGWTSPAILTLLVVGALGLPAFLLVERRSANPMLELRFFRDPSFAGANAVAVLSGFALLGFVFFNTLYFQTVQGWSPLEAGLRTAPNTLMIVLIAPFAGRLASHFGYWVPVVAGTAVGGVALLLYAATSRPGTSYLLLLGPLVLLGVGFGLLISPMVAAAIAGMPPGQAGVASATVNTNRQVGGALGVAVLGAIVTARFNTLLAPALGQLHLPEAVQRRVEAVASQGGGAIGSSTAGGAAVRRAVGDAFTSGIHTAYLVSGSGLLIAAVLALVLLRPRAAARPAEVAVAEPETTEVTRPVA
jgi:hypothetical protein